MPMPLDLVEFADNPAPRCPYVLVLDVSASMAGPAIDALNDGLRAFQREISRSPLADQMDVAIVTFGSTVQVAQPFIPAATFRAPVLVARGQTSLGRAIQTALTLLGERRSEYREQGVACQRPWVLLVTDGAPTGEPDYVVEQARASLLAAQMAQELTFIAVGTERAEVGALSWLSLPNQPPLVIAHAQLGELFEWLSGRSHAPSSGPAPGPASIPLALPPRG
jgi:uncharacterized protein YegL